ncbi:unnamed protein product [Candida verbasci]|uniref:AB hydrolase-1 domain-containing protein n=1 Tax=Candida verbasci TaxID=1227364 RepID=A0A9W4TSS9_9ASCO|nr:unnamed protein product [Candida verbasci]
MRSVIFFKRCFNKRPSFNIDSIQDLPFSENIELAYNFLQPKNARINLNKTPVLFLHGLFGSKLSFNSNGRELTRIIHNPVYTVDLRNHGDSPHVLPHNYITMAHDISKFINDQKWNKCILIGHSMGAKVAMLVSLLYSKLIEKLVVIDNTPHSQRLDDSYYNDLLAMCEIEHDSKEFKNGDMRIVDIDKVDDKLKDYEESSHVRSLLKSNLIRTKKDIERIPKNKQSTEAFKIPVMNFYKHNIIDSISSWPNLHVDKFNNPVLVMYGNQSKFVLPEYFKKFDEYFTNVKFQEFDTGHYISVDDPLRFVHSLARFIEPKVEESLQTHHKRHHIKVNK